MKSVSSLIKGQNILHQSPFVARRMMSTDSLSDLEKSKIAASKKAVSERIFDGSMVIGIGSGSTIVYAVQFIAEKIRSIHEQALNEGRKSDLNVVCIPSSFQAKQLILDNNLTLGSLEQYPEIEWTIDGADEVDSKCNLIKGGGGCHTQEKVLACASKKLYIVADYSKKSHVFGEKWKKGVPIEVIPIGLVPVKKQIECMFGGEAVLRMGKAKAGPVVTDNGNFILDWKFPPNIKPNSWKEVNVTLSMIPGVVETGLFLNMAEKVYIGNAKGEVFEYERDIT